MSRMNKHLLRGLSATLCGALIIGSVGTAALSNRNIAVEQEIGNTNVSALVNNGATKKDETVYVIANADGSAKKIIVSDWINNAGGKKKITDKSELSDIQNVKGDEKYTLNDDKSIVWDTEGNDIYYQGNITKQLPVDIKISYKLDGKTVTADELNEKSGKVTIRFDYTNNQYETVKINGKEEKIYVPFAMLTGMVLDNSTFKNIEVSNGKIINDGDRTVVAGIALPSLAETLNITDKSIDIPDYVEVTADVTNFKLPATMTLATNEFVNGIDLTDSSDLDSASKAIDQLTDAVNQLLSGSSQLYNGLAQLLDKSDVLIEGINKLAAGAADLKAGADELDSGASELQSGASQLSSGLSELISNNTELTQGAKQVFDTFLDTANEQLKALTQAGITVPTLTVENYATVLTNVIKTLDEKITTLSKAQTGLDTIEENLPKIEAGITQYEQLLQNPNLDDATRQQYETAKAQLETQKNTLEAQKAAIKQQLAASGITTDEELTITLTTLKNAKSSVEGAKKQLDSYNKFYQGILDYTSAASEASAGADKLASGTDSLKAGTTQLTDGADQLYNGLKTLKDGSSALKKGVKQLTDGAMQLNNGMQKFYDEGISKLTKLAGDDLTGFTARINAMVNASKNYTSFSGIADDMDGSVKFIYKTDGSLK